MRLHIYTEYEVTLDLLGTPSLGLLTLPAANGAMYSRHVRNFRTMKEMSPHPRTHG